MRKGENPSKDRLPAYQPERLGIAIVSYIPSLGGYFEHSLEVLKYEIASIHHSTSAKFDLYVFDNGSCSEAQAELYRLHVGGWIDFLLSSRHNLGKIGAINWILGAVPNELIGYSDSDVLFRPGWYENSLAILKSFPNSGMISAQPCLDDVLRGKGKAQFIFDNDPGYHVENRAIDPQWVDEYVQGFGLSPEFGYPPELTSDLKKNVHKFVTDRHSGVQAVVGANHVQFLMPSEVARAVVPLPTTTSLSRKEDLELNKKVDQKGYLHLSTPEPYCYHMGNTPDEIVLAEVRRMNLQEIFQKPPRKEAPGKARWDVRLLNKLNRFRLFRSMIYRSYKLLFELYSRRNER